MLRAFSTLTGQVTVSLFALHVQSLYENSKGTSFAAAMEEELQAAAAEVAAACACSVACQSPPAQGPPARVASARPGFMSEAELRPLVAVLRRMAGDFGAGFLVAEHVLEAGESEFQHLRRGLEFNGVEYLGPNPARVCERV